MANCPLCGEKGDDLIFKFYCSNKSCANYTGECEEQEIKLQNSKHKKKSFSIPPRFGLWNDCCDFKYRSSSTIPNFHIHKDGDNDFIIVFDSDVPNDVRQTLGTILAPHLDKFIGFPCTSEMSVNIYIMVEAKLKDLVRLGVLYFDIFNNCWALDI